MTWVAESRANVIGWWPTTYSGDVGRGKEIRGDIGKLEGDGKGATCCPSTCTGCSFSNPNPNPNPSPNPNPNPNPNHLPAEHLHGLILVVDDREDALGRVRGAAHREGERLGHVGTLVQALVMVDHECACGS